MGKKCPIGYLPQESAPTGEETVLELATAIDQKLAETLKILREHPDEEDPERLEALEKYAEMEGYTLEAKAKKTLSGLSFHVDDFNKPAKTLSGGWVMRAHLARLLVMEPDLLMLDEPTNHLDLETLGWFQEQMRKFPGSVLTISHDREFLNSTCNRSSRLVIKSFTVIRETLKATLHKRQSEKLSILQHTATSNAKSHIMRTSFDVFAKASKASQAQSRIKLLEKMERIEAPESTESTLSFSFPQPPRSGQK